MCSLNNYIANGVALEFMMLHYLFEFNDLLVDLVAKIMLTEGMEFLTFNTQVAITIAVPTPYLIIPVGVSSSTYLCCLYVMADILD